MNTRSIIRRLFFRGSACLILCGLASSCAFPPLPDVTTVNPFTDAAPIPLDGQARAIESDIVPLGDLEAGRVIRVDAQGEAIEEVLLLTADDAFPNAAVIVGGGRVDEPFDYRVRMAGPYFIFVVFDPEADDAQRTGTLGVGPGDATYQPPGRQVVLVEFDPGFLSDPGLFDPTSGTPDDQAFLEAISDQVRSEIVAAIQAIFAETPMEIITADDPAPTEPFSRLRYSPERVIAEQQDVIDAALPPPDPSRPECQVRVVFGEVLPRGSRQDPGNQRRNDEAVVYVGSFQGRGETCRTSVTDSVNNIVLALAQTGAHEIGHLIGLYHVEQIDMMNRSATLAFLRELPFERGQIQIERSEEDTIVTEVLTTIVQDPDLYFRANFAWPE